MNAPARQSQLTPNKVTKTKPLCSCLRSRRSKSPRDPGHYDRDKETVLLIWDSGMSTCSSADCAPRSYMVNQLHYGIAIRYRVGLWVVTIAILPYSRAIQQLPRTWPNVCTLHTPSPTPVTLEHLPKRSPSSPSVPHTTLGCMQVSILGREAFRC